MIKPSLIKIIFIIKFLINFYTTEEFAYKDGWDCVEKILFNPNLMRVLIKMPDSQCERDILDFKTIFGQVDMGGENKQNTEGGIDDVLKKVGKLNSKIDGKDLAALEEQIAQFHLMHKNREDSERNGEFDKITLKTAYTKKNFKEINSEIQRSKFMIFFEEEGNQSIKYLKNLDKFIIPENEEITDNDTKISKNKFDKNLNLDKGLLENDNNTYKFKSSNISKKGDQRSDINSISDMTKEVLKKKNKKDNSNDSEEEEVHAKFNNWDEDMEDEIEIPEPDGDFYTNSLFTIKPLLKIKMEHYNKTEKQDEVEGGETFYAIQTRLKPKQTRLLETDKRSNNEIIKELFLYFELLPNCIKRALNQCPIIMENVLKKCNNFYKDKGLECRYLLNQMKVTIKCEMDEEFFNNACYKKCPKGYKDGKLYCVRSKYIRRSTAPYKGQGIDSKSEKLWGDTFIVKKCENFGSKWVEVGSDYCRQNCPLHWESSGILCKKPYRFLNQKIFLFDQDDSNK